MKKIMMYGLLMPLLLIAGLTNSAEAQSKSDVILGEWQPVKKNSHIIIYKRDGKYYGKLKLLQPGNFQDVRNPNHSLRTRNIMGLPMLNDFIYDGDNTWTGGSIYDPNDGRTYSCKLSLKSPDELNVRGYVGISLFGRTEVWTRIKN